MKSYYSTARSLGTCLGYPTPSGERCPCQTALSVPWGFVRMLSCWSSSCCAGGFGGSRLWQCGCGPCSFPACPAARHDVRAWRWGLPVLAAGGASPCPRTRGSPVTGRAAEGLLCVWCVWQQHSVVGLLRGVKKPGDRLSLPVFWLIFNEPNNINKWTVLSKVMLLHFELA